MLALKLRQSSCFSLSNTDNGHQNHHQILLLAAEWLSSPRTGSRKVGGRDQHRDPRQGFPAPFPGLHSPDTRTFFSPLEDGLPTPVPQTWPRGVTAGDWAQFLAVCRLGATTPLLSLSQTSQEAFRKSFYSCPSSPGHLLGDP